MYISGHEHIYERMWPVYGNMVNSYVCTKCTPSHIIR